MELRNMKPTEKKKKKQDNFTEFLYEIIEEMKGYKHEWNIIADYKKGLILEEANKKVLRSKIIDHFGIGIRIITKSGERLISFNHIPKNWKDQLRKFKKRYEKEKTINYFIEDHRKKIWFGKKHYDYSFDNIKELSSNAKAELEDKKINYNIITKFESHSRWFINENSEIFQNWPRSVFVLKLYDKQNESYEKDVNIGNLEKLNPEKVIKKAKKYLEDLKKAKSFKPGRYNIIADGSLTSVFIHEALGHASESDLVLKNASCLKNKLEKKIGNEFTNVYDSPLGINHELQWGSYRYDDEGIKAKKTRIIENGILKTYLISLKTYYKLKADKRYKNYQLQPTGNSRVEDFSYTPLVRMSNTYIEKGDYNNQELIEELKNGLLLKKTLGGQVNTTAGNFQFNSFVGYIIKNRKIVGSIKGASLQGNTLEVLKNIIAIGKTYEKVGAGTCGKEGQGVPVGGFNPRILIKNAIIGTQ